MLKGNGFSKRTMADKNGESTLSTGDLHGMLPVTLTDALRFTLLFTNLEGIRGSLQEISGADNPTCQASAVKLTASIHIETEEA